MSAIQLIDHSISELLPSLTSVRVCLMSANAENCVEQQHTLLSPMGQLAMVREWNPEVLVELLKDILQGWRWLHTSSDREAQSMSLIRSVVGILTQNHDADGVEGREPEGVKHVLTGRVDQGLGLLPGEELSQMSDMWFRELVFDDLKPRVG